jgi:hypothetical protein
MKPVACTAVAMQWLRVGEYTTTVSEQQLGKHVPAETNTRVIIDHPVPGGYEYGNLMLQVGPCPWGIQIREPDAPGWTLSLGDMNTGT